MSRKRITLLITALVIGAAATAGALLCEKKSDAMVLRPTYDCTDEQILTFPYFDLVAASGENRNLPCDVESYSIGDGYIHLILPDDVPETCVAVYIRDIDGNYLARRVYDFTNPVMIGEWEVVLDHATLPVMYFESEDPDVYTAMNERDEQDIICDGNMHIRVGEKESKDNGWYREYLSRSDDRSAKTTASLQGRGNSSWHTANKKKSYTLRLSKSQNLLGMGEHKSWNLIGNAFDLSLIRNITFNGIAKKAGVLYQPEMRNINLFVDGKYEGVYTLTTKVKQGKRRVPLKKGDYFYKMDPPHQDQPVLYESKTWTEDGGDYPVADIVYPEVATGDELEASQKILQRFIDAVESPKETPDLEDIADLESIARYYWVEEMSMNYDAWSRSLYMYYKHNDGKMYLGPVWDMDLTLGAYFEKQNVPFDDPEGWKIRCGGWFKTLFEDERFKKAVSDVYFNGGVREALLGGVYDLREYKRALGDDGDVNYLLFGNANVRDMNLDFGYDYEEYTDGMIDFYKRRAEWIDNEMRAEEATSP